MAKKRKITSKETLSTRVTRLEEAIIRVANAQAHLAEVQAQQAERIEALRAEALERDKRVDERFEQLLASINTRIEKLVSAIGERIARSEKK